MTILELAKELNVSKTAVRQHITAEFRERYMNQVNGTFQINAAGCELLRESFQKLTGNLRKQVETAAGNLPESSVSGLIEMLQRELEIKNSQITELNARLAETTAALTETTSALQAAQALHAGTLQHQLEKPKKGLFRWLGKKGQER